MERRYIYKIGFLITLLWFASACTDETELSGNADQADGKEVPVNILSRVVAGDENKVSKLRLIIFSTRTSDPYGPRTLTRNQLISTKENYTAITYVGYNDIYMIGNEPVDLSGVTTPEELKIRMDTESMLAASEFVFYRQLLNVNVRSKNEIYVGGQTKPVSELEIPLQRVIAKLTVKFDLSTEIYEGDNPTGKYLEFESMELVRVPKYSYLVPGKYEMANGFRDDRSFSLENSSTEPNHFTWSSGEIYLPEYLLDNDEYRTFLRIKGTSGSVVCTYTLPVGDGMNPLDSYSDEWNITRNRHYTLTVKGIRGYGEKSLEANARVAGWSEVNVPMDIPGASFLVVNKKEVEVNSIRFYTYIRFTSSNPVEEVEPVANTEVMYVKTEYDDATHKSGRVGFKRGNWNQTSNATYVAKLRSGAAVVDLTLKFLTRDKTQKIGEADWATAIGYSAEANNNRAHEGEAGNYFNVKMYHQATGDTGCRGYYPPGVAADDKVKGKGCWRLPTIKECAAYFDRPYWAIDESEYNMGYVCYGYNYGYINIWLEGKPKASSNPYFCVLDTRPPGLSDFVVSDEDITGIMIDMASSTCISLGKGWRLPTGGEMKYVFQYAGTNGLPNNFFSDSYWGQNGDMYIVADMNDPDGSKTTDAMRVQPHTVRCVKPRFE